MYKVERKEKIYLYDIEKGCYTNVFPNLDNTLKFIAANSKYSWKGFESDYLTNLNMGNDYYFITDYIHSYKNKLGILSIDVKTVCINKRFMFVDEYLRILDMRVYKNKIDEYIKTKNTEYVNLVGKRNKAKYMIVPINCEFRVDPIPYTGDKRYRIKGYRCPKTTQEKRISADTEIDIYIRSKRKSKNLPSTYDDKVRSRFRSKSWKDCSKKRKQWM